MTLLISRVLGVASFLRLTSGTCVTSGRTLTLTGVGCVLKTGTWQSSNVRESGIRYPFPIQTRRRVSLPLQLGKSVRRCERRVRSIASHWRVRVPSGQTDNSAPLTSPTVSEGSHSTVTVNPSRLAKRNRRVILFLSYLYGGLDFLVEETIGPTGLTSTDSTVPSVSVSWSFLGAGRSGLSTGSGAAESSAGSSGDSAVSGASSTAFGSVSGSLAASDITKLLVV